MQFSFEKFTSQELAEKEWLPELVHLINDSYLNRKHDPVGHTQPRLEDEQELLNDLGDTGFTTVAFDADRKIVATASVKPWKDEGLWIPVEGEHEAPQKCPGDYEIILVVVKEDPKYRGKGLSDSLLELCYQTLREGEEKPPRLMLKVIQELYGPYWGKKGYQIVAKQRCESGTWGIQKPFTLLAMAQVLPM